MGTTTSPQFIPRRLNKKPMKYFSLLVEPFSLEFMRDALCMALPIAVMCGMLGVLLVPRGLSMLGDGLAHATLGGVGAGLLLGLVLSLPSGLPCHLPFC